MSHVFCEYHISYVHIAQNYGRIFCEYKRHIFLALSTNFPLFWTRITYILPSTQGEFVSTHSHIQVCVPMIERKGVGNLRPRRSDSSAKVGVFLSFVSEIPRKNAGVRNSSFRKPAAGAHTGVFGRVSDQRRAIEDDEREMEDRERERKRERKRERERRVRERIRQSEKKETRKIQRPNERVRGKEYLHLCLLLTLSLALSRMFQVNRTH